MALALLPLAAITQAQTQAAPADAPRQAQIDASTGSVPFGEQVTLHGAFPSTDGAAVELRYRPSGADAWQTAARTRTGASGRYQARVKPRRSGIWRAELASEQTGGASPASPPASADRASGAKRITVRSRTTAKVGGRHAVVGDTFKVRGSVAPAGARRRVVVRVGSEKEVVSAGRDGRFAVPWKASATGSYPVRVEARGNALAAGSSDSAGRVTVYRRAAASWYGPGLYGNSLACGGTLTPSTVGVAHKTMPCGTKLTLRYRGRSIDVRVIDRGPFAGNREFDLTAATKQALGFPDVGTVLTSR